MDTDTHRIFGVPVECRSRKGVESIIRETLGGKRFRRIATANPEFFVRARRDACFRENLLAADYRIADGFGIVLDGFLSGKKIVRYPGADLLSFVLSEAERSQSSAFLLVRNDGLSTLPEVIRAIRARYTRLVVDGETLDPKSIIVPDAARRATVVLCNFGAPEQEYALESFRKDPGNIRLAMGVGGSFDFLTGRRKRAPERMRTVGLEWFFRLLVQPRRIGRIWTATVVFPFLRLSDRIKSVSIQER
ncbi:MAG: WecB/TagA/CpsF family glycosyltransferase [Candidatus Moranbacteria bacterium]|nr:WecB/TagA/CpsF family glycosyltransferase [Candidatus Moranbacteria bacterium]